jgi:hypothetical protein
MMKPKERRTGIERRVFSYTACIPERRLRNIDRRLLKRQNKPRLDFLGREQEGGQSAKSTHKNAAWTEFRRKERV